MKDNRHMMYYNDFEQMFASQKNLEKISLVTAIPMRKLLETIDLKTLMLKYVYSLFEGEARRCYHEHVNNQRGNFVDAKEIEKAIERSIVRGRWNMNVAQRWCRTNNLAMS